MFRGIFIIFAENLKLLKFYCKNEIAMLSPSPSPKCGEGTGEMPVRGTGATSPPRRGEEKGWELAMTRIMTFQQV
ncbi:MAG: hypothetical protein M1536_00940 [Firmicutes bacterium]|nr:hypothetical protein [Bacillota bacterium]